MQFHRLFSAAITLLVMAASTLAQDGRFTINGRVKIEGGGLDGTRVVVMRNGVKDRVLTNNLSKFSLELDLGQNYTLCFEKDGFVTKKLSFDTHAPADAAANGFTAFEFAVSLFKQYDDVNTVVFNQPVGMIRYDATLGDFDYDTDYTKSIQSQLQQAQQAVAKKQEEEAEQEKARAKEEAAAKAKAAEEDKALARQQKEQEEEARKAGAERRKAEAAAQKPPPAPKVKEKPDPAPAVRAEAPPKPPAPVTKVEARKPPPPPPPATARATPVKANAGTDQRRSPSARTGSEANPVRPAKAVAGSEERPDVTPPEHVTVRNEQLIVEPNQVITLITVDTDARTLEYRKVVRKYGSVHYFRNGVPCSQLVYEREALAENR